MGSTLSNGYFLPADGDQGDTVFDGLEANIQRLNDHTHDGSDSARIPATRQAIASGSWSSEGDDTYSQTVSLPGSLEYDDISIEIRLSTGDKIFPTLEKASSTSYKIYVNDNSLDLVGVYR